MDRANAIFDQIDADRSGEIDSQELTMALLGLGQEHETVSDLFRVLDTDGNGSISREEFIAGFDLYQKGEARLAAEARVVKVATSQNVSTVVAHQTANTPSSGPQEIVAPEATNAAAPLAATASTSTFGLKAKKLGGVDPRWDVVGFDEWLAGCPCVRVGFLRASKPVGRHQVTEDEWVTELPHGAGIDGVQLYAILSAAFGTRRSSNLAASELDTLLQALKDADEGDLVWWDCLAFATDDGGAGRAEAFRAFTTYKAQCVVLPTIAGHDSTSVFACMEPMALLALSCFCQRIYNASDAKVKEGLDLSKFFDLSGLLVSLQRESDSQLAFVAEMLEEVLTLNT